MMNINIEYDSDRYLPRVSKKAILYCSCESVFDATNNKLVKKIINTDNDQELKLKANIYPEIGKKRPVIVIKINKELNRQTQKVVSTSALVVPLTTKEPIYHQHLTVFIPKEHLIGKLRVKDSYALCESIQLVSLKRLHGVYEEHGNRRVPLSDSKINNEYFTKIIKNIQQIFKV